MQHVKSTDKLTLGSEIHSALRLFLSCCVLLASVAAGKVAVADEAAELLALFAGGKHVALMRHALAPGTGDPVNFSPGDCSTQRNLDETGRQQARSTGDLLVESGVVELQIYSSQWCRCMDTATGLGIGDVQSLALLNSFFASMHEREQRTRELRDWLLALSWDNPVLLVTHQVNITALTGVYPSSGEILILNRSEDDVFNVVGTIKTLN